LANERSVHARCQISHKNPAKTALPGPLPLSTWEATDMDRRWIGMGVIAVLLICFVGCLPEKTGVHVQGTVTIGGKPIPADAQASICFSPTTVKQPNSSSAEITGGKYDASGVPKGKVLVSFIVMQPTGEVKPFEPGARAEMQMRSLVPPAKAGGVEVEIAGDNPNLNFDL
jgi:hypothetical protein